jgi:hypothetical protein
MNYSIGLYLHIVGALGFFVALGVEWVSMRYLRRAATAEQVREWVRVSTGIRRLGFASMMTLLASGFYMMAIAQIGGAWVFVAFWALVLLAIIAVTLSFRRMAAIDRAASTEAGPLSAALRQAVEHPLLWVAIKLRVAIALGIVYLMTLKPTLIGSLLAIGIAAIIGLVLALPMLGRRAQKEPAT